MRRALLIGSPFGGLRGTINDVETMESVLTEQGFSITKCFDKDATRAGILKAWRDLIAVTSSEDTVVIYYSGHGGIIEDPTEQASTNTASSSTPNKPWRYQFLIPMDFMMNESSAIPTVNKASFNGILDLEIACLLRDMTKRTTNVTTIFDCCHSGRMARDPSHPEDAQPRNLPKVEFADISQYIESLRQLGELSQAATLHTEDNPHAVRVAAATSAETAWEYHQDASGRWVGAMTEALSQAIREAWGAGKGEHVVTWRTALMRVQGLVNVSFPQQNPHVEGPDTRLLFSTEKATTGALVLLPDGEDGILQAGRASGVREDNVYALMPFGSEKVTAAGRLGTATVVSVVGFQALVEVSLLPGKPPIPQQGVMAFLEKEALYKWPVSVPTEPIELSEAIARSTALRPAAKNETPLALFQLQGQKLVLVTQQGVPLDSQAHALDGSWEAASKQLVQQAEKLAKAQHLLSLNCESDDERLDHSLEVVFGTVENKKPARAIEQDGDGFVVEGDPIYISLKNNGQNTIYVSVININVAGSISLVSKSQAKGIELPPGRPPYVLGQNSFRVLKGLTMGWPSNIPRIKAVNERLVFIVTDAPVYLKYLADSTPSDHRGDVGQSSLEQLAFRFATGGQRDMTSESRCAPLQYDILHIPFTIRPLAVDDTSESLQTIPLDSKLESLSLTDLPEPEEAMKGEELPRYSPFLEQSGRGAFGSLIRATKGIKPFVWVVNEHSEDITVVVSKYRPHRLLSGGGINAAADGGGINFSTTTFESPPCKKTIPARIAGEDASVGAFPLWSRNEAFGVVTILKGPEKAVFIEHDLIPLGATAFFSNKPNLRIVDYQGKEVAS